MSSRPAASWQITSGDGEITAQRVRQTGRPGLFRAEVEGQPWLLQTFDSGAVADKERERCRSARRSARVEGTIVAEGEHDGDLVFGRPLVEGQTLDHALEEGPLDMDAWLSLAWELASRVEALHAKGALHLQIAPEHILLKPHVALLDTGLPFVAPQPDGAPPAFAAPEQLGLLQAPIGPPTDLHSLGLTLYAALTGRPLYDGSTVREVLAQQLTVVANIDVVSDDPRLPAIREILHRLLRKEPNDRYQRPAGLLADLEAVREGDPERLIVGSVDIRRSLTEPAFIGRRGELAALDSHLATLAQGTGGTVILEGESGGGKTRLLDEMAHHAKAQGIEVLRGQGVDQAAPRPFQMFQGVADGLVHHAAGIDPVALRERMRDWVAEASEALPQLQSWWGHEGSSAGPDEMGEHRTLSALQALLGAVGTPKQPVLVILDDAQWADEATRRLLLAWSRQAPSATLVVAAYRSDEVGDGDTLRRLAAPVVRLGGLTDGDVADLVASAAGLVPHQAVDTIVRLAEGSPFMATAVLHGLLETGALRPDEQGWQVDAEALREATASREAADLLARRFHLLAEEDLRLLTTGAVLGKRFDVALAARLGHLPEDRAQVALMDAQRRRIVWPVSRDGSAAFVHDKLRETLLGMLDEAGRRALHREAAESLKRRSDAHAFDLAYHFAAAGDPAAALPYALDAADRARRQYSLEVAQRNYEIALAGVKPHDDALRLRISEALGDVLLLRGRYDDCATHLEAARNLARTDVEKSRILTKIGELLFKQGDVHNSNLRLEEALSLTGAKVPRSGFAYLRHALREVLVQAGHTLRPSRVGHGDLADAEEAMFQANLLSRLAHGYWFEKGKVPCLWAHLREMNIAEQYAPSTQRVTAYAEHGPVMTMLPWFSRGKQYTGRAVEMAREVGDLWAEGQAECYDAVAKYGAAEFVPALEASKKAALLLRRTGDPWQGHVARWHVAIAYYRLGRLAEAAEAARETHADADEVGDHQAAAICLGILAKATGGAVDLEAFDAIAGRHLEDVHAQSEFATGRAIVLLHRGEAQEAVAVLAEAWKRVKARGFQQEYVAPVLPWYATALRSAIEHDPLSATAHHKRLAKVTRLALRWARKYPNNLPHAWRERALWHALHGRRSRAERDLEASRRAAEDQGAEHEVLLTAWAAARVDQALAGGPADACRTARRAVEASWPVATEVLTPTIIDQFETMLETGRDLARTLDRDDVLEKSVRAAHHLLHADASVAAPDGTALVGHARLDPDLLEACVQSGGAETSTGRHGTSAACAPIQTSAGIEAFLHVVRHDVSEPLGDTELQLLEFVAGLTAAAWENAEGFQRLAEAKHELEYQHGLLAKLNDLSLDGILVVGRKGEILSFNDRFAQMWRIPAEVLAERSDEAAVAAVMSQLEDPGAFRERIEYLYEHPDEESNDELRLREGRIFERHSAAMVDRNGANHGRVWFFRDVTQQRRDEEELRRAYEDLKQLDVMKSQFVNTAAHELNTPLTAIKLQMLLIDRETESFPPKLQASIKVLRRNLERLGRLAGDILDSARIQSHHMPILREETDMAALAEQACHTFKEHAAASNVVLALEAQPAVIHGDPGRLTQVLHNLLSNAIKFAPDGTVDVRVHGAKGRIRVEVEDSGRGMTEENRHNLFQPFSQLESADMRSGTGLGLYVVKGIVEAHGGSIGVESPGEGLGSTFWFEVPAEGLPED